MRGAASKRDPRTRPLKTLDEVDVGYLLHNMGFGQYLRSFLRVGVNGEDLAFCKDEDFTACGITFR